MGLFTVAAIYVPDGGDKTHTFVPVSTGYGHVKPWNIGIGLDSHLRRKGTAVVGL